MRRFIKVFLVLFFIALIAIQFIKVDRTNPPITGEINAPEKVKVIFKEACWDCHSNETKWPWYSYIAPVSFFIESDVSEGRKHLNFSEWEKYNDRRKSRKKEEIWEQVNNGDMPMKTYTYLHPKSNLDYTQKSIIKDWSTKKVQW